MGLMNLLTRFLPLTQEPIFSTTTTRSFNLQAWLPESALHKQPVSWYATSKTTGYLGLEIHSPDTPLPSTKLATFNQNKQSPSELFISNPSDPSKYLSVIVQYDGEVQYTSLKDLPGDDDEFAPHTGNFSTDYFVYWPDGKNYDFVDFQPPGFVTGVFLACPGKLGEGEAKGYRLFAMTPVFKHGGCITLEWLVLTKIGGEKMVDVGDGRA